MATGSGKKQMAELDMTLRTLAPKFIDYVMEAGKKNNKSAVTNFHTWSGVATPGQIEAVIKKVNKLVKSEESRAKVLRTILTFAEKNKKFSKENGDLLQDAIDKENKVLLTKQKQVEVLKKINAAKVLGLKLLDKSIKSNEKIFEISHKMQLESNVTWENYRQLYKEGYEATRRMNDQIGQSVHNVRDLINSQEKLLSEGWRDIDPSILNSVAGSVMTLSKTLGAMDSRLLTAFQNSYRIFGAQTDTFVTALGNRMNAFSDTFGISLGMLQGSVADMMDSNNFISRSNMSAQITANESLMRAAALSANIGLTSATFITDLAKTSQYGTMEEMAGIYEGGALLDGFDTGNFQEKMIGQDYAGATKDLFSGIQKTLNGIDDHYVRAEYMSRIGSTFGLSDDELLRITTHGDNLEEYNDSTLSKLAGADTSMRDELANLKMAVTDRLDNWWENSWGSQAAGATMQELGLYGLGGMLGTITKQLNIIIGQNALGGGKAGSLLKGLGSTSGTTSGLMAANPLALSNGARLGGGIAGLAIAGGANYAGRQIQGNQNLTNSQANIGGGAMNIVGGIGGGALTGLMAGGIPGAAIGGIIGAGIGIANTIKGAEDRKSAISELDSQRRESARANSGASFLTGEPIVDAINAQTDVLKRTLDDNYEENRRVIVLGKTIEATKASID